MVFITQGKTNWKFLLIVVILAAIAGGAIWFLSTPRIEQPLTPEEPVIPEEEISEEAEDETTDWQTYRNEEYGFEIKYPSFWSIDETYMQKRVFIAEGIYTKEYLAPDDYCFIQFEFEDPISEIDYAIDRGYQQEDVKIAGHPALKLSLKLSNVEIDDYYIKQNETYYFGVRFYKRENYADICNKVFSTLRILN